MSGDRIGEVTADPTTAEETIERLCKLLYRVHENLGDGFADGPCDCICPSKPTTSWRSTGEALRFTEQAVTNALTMTAEIAKLKETIAVLGSLLAETYTKVPTSDRGCCETAYFEGQKQALRTLPSGGDRHGA